MQIAGLAPTGSYSEITYNMAPRMDLNIDWLQILKTPAEKVDSANWYLKIQQDSNLNSQRQIKDVDLSTLNQDQLFSANAIQQNMYSQTLMIIMRGPGTGKLQ